MGIEYHIYFWPCVTLRSQTEDNYILKGLAQTKIIKKSVILFWLLNMTIWCKHVHRLDLQKFLIFLLRIHQLG